MTDHDRSDDLADDRAHAASERRRDYGPRGSRDARGPHIRETVPHAPPSAYEVTPIEPDADVKTLAIQIDTLTTMMSKLVIGHNGVKPEGSDMTLPKPRFDGTVSWGNILVAVGFAVSAAIGYANQQSMNQHFEEALKQNATEIAKVRIEGEARATKYAPMIETAARLNDSQDSRMTSLSVSVQQLRDVVTDLTKLAAQTDRALAVWIAQHGRDGLPVPMGR